MASSGQKSPPILALGAGINQWANASQPPYNGGALGTITQGSPADLLNQITEMQQQINRSHADYQRRIALLEADVFELKLIVAGEKMHADIPGFGSF